VLSVERFNSHNNLPGFIKEIDDYKPFKKVLELFLLPGFIKEIDDYKPFKKVLELFLLHHSFYS